LDKNVKWVAPPRGKWEGGGEGVLPSNAMSSAGGKIDLVED